MRSLIVLLMFSICTYTLSAQEKNDIVYIMDFLGAGSEDEIDSYEMERLQDLLERPLKLNLASDSRIISSALLSPYQLASFKDYRAGAGDVLSFAELASLDGFGEDFVRRLAPFVSLETSAPVSRTNSTKGRIEHDMAVRMACKFIAEEKPSLNYALKYRLEAGERMSAAISFAKSYDNLNFLPEKVAGYLKWNFRKYSAKLILGNYNARFAQGLVFWNGLVLSGVNSPYAFMRKASGISSSWSFNPSSSMKGIAASMLFGKLSLALAYSFPGQTVANLTWYLKNGQVGLNNHAEFSNLFTAEARIPILKTSADARFCFSGVNIFSEFAYDWVSASPACLLAAIFPLARDFNLASMLRLYPEDYNSEYSGAVRSLSKCANEYSCSISTEGGFGTYVKVNGTEGFASSVRKHKTTFSFDMCYFPESKSETISNTWQIKSSFVWESMLNSYLKVRLMLKERIRNWETYPFKTEFRVDFNFYSRHLYSNLRFNLMDVSSPSFLAYLETGYKNDRLSVYLREGVFFIDNWESRIYVYERDAPGSFNVPAFYGRGLWLSMNASWKFSRWGRLYLRASTTSYLFMDEAKKKPGKAELKLQYVLSF